MGEQRSCLSLLRDFIRSKGFITEVHIKRFPVKIRDKFFTDHVKFIKEIQSNKRVGRRKKGVFQEAIVLKPSALCNCKY